jgi:hypothetical protein
MSQSPETAGGAGFTFADRVAARYLASLLVEASAPGLADRRVSRVALEQRPAGEPLDDLVVDAVAPDGSMARLSLQVKRQLVISSAKSNEDFRAIIRDAWTTLDKEDFRDGVDRVGAVVGPSTAVATSRDLQAVAEFARASARPSDFAQRFGDGGSASKAHSAIVSSIQTITADLSLPASIEDLHRLLAHFVLIRFDTLHAGATDDAVALTLLEHALVRPGAEAAGGRLLRVLLLRRRAMPADPEDSYSRARGPLLPGARELMRATIPSKCLADADKHAAALPPLGRTDANP